MATQWNDVYYEGDKFKSKWLSRYQQASFRNVEFFIKGHSVTGGRRLARHGFPNVDDVQYEDMGKKEPKFTLDAYIIADDYFQQRNDFEDALNATGSGTLIHPYRGTIEVYVEEFTVSEVTEEGRMARFSISFVLSKPEVLTVEKLFTSELVLDKKTNLLDAIHNAFVNAYNNAMLAVNKLNKLVAALQQIDNMIEDAKMLMQPFAEFQAILSNAEGKLIAIAVDAEMLYDSIKSLTDFGSDTNQSTAPTADNSKSQFLSLLQTTDSYVMTSGTPQEQQIILLQNKVSIASCASLLLAVPFTSADEAQDMADLIGARIDTMIEDDTTSDEEYIAFIELRSALYSNISQRALQLAKLKDISLIDTRPSLVIANTLYGSVDNEQDLVDRNKIQHPAFVPGGIPLKVLTNV